MSGTGNRFYPEEEADEILRIAAADSVVTTAMTRERLVAVAAELGIPEESVARAEAKLAEERTLGEQEKKDKELFAKYRARRKQNMLGELRGWLSFSVLLLGIDFLTERTITWSIWPVGMLGLFQIGHLIEAVLTPPARDERFERWKQKHARREAKQASE